MISFQDMIGKTIIAVDDSSSNCVKFTFEGGEQCTVFAECDSNSYDTPFFELFGLNEPISLDHK